MGATWKYSLAILFVFCFLGAKAQYYITGQDPASVKWFQIKTPAAKIIFPHDAQRTAQEYAGLLQLSSKAVATPYLQRMRPVKIVLHNLSTLSNAMVSPTPMHADYFLTPDQETYAQRWSKQLTLHEYRHVVQMQKLKQGFGKGLYFAFGDQAVGALMGLFLPFWFIEGDAVFSETIYSQSGRGRSPEFVMDLKAQVVEKGIFSYDKAQYGSYRDYVPDHYTLGYQLVLFGLINYSPDIWDQTLNKVARRPYSLMPFSNGIRHFTGVGKAKYYKEVLFQLKSEWLANLPENSIVNFVEQPMPTDYTDYRFALPLSNGGFVAEKSGIDDVTRFVKIDPTGREKVLKTPGYGFSQSLSGNDTLIVWNEKTYDPRWANRDYSVIKAYHTQTGKTEQLTHRSRLFAPSLSNDGSMIAAVNIDKENRYYLSWLNSYSGQVVGKFHFPDNWFLITPSWASDDKSLVLVVLSDQGKAIVRFSPQSNEIDTLVPFGFVDIGQPILNNSLLVFKSALNGTNNLYCKDLKTENVYRLTESRYGVSDPAFFTSGDSLSFAEYTPDGYRIATLSLSSSMTPVGQDAVGYRYPIDALTPPYPFNIDEVVPEDTLFPIKKYSRLAHLFNFHSWGLTGFEIDNYSFSPGVNVLSQNVLSTSTAYAGYYYDPDEQAGKIKAGFDYMGWYPVVSVAAETGRRTAAYTDTAQIKQALNWRETDLATNVSVPLNFTSSRWLKGIEPMVGISLKFRDMDKDVQVQFKEDQITSLTYRFYGYIQYKRSQRDLFPRWGQTVQATFRHTPFSEYTNQQLALTSVSYFPGLFSHHGIRAYIGYQQSAGNSFTYGNLVSTPRGYSGLYMTEFQVLKADYAFPVAYPDWDIPSIMYLKRISSHLFYDIASGIADQQNKTVSSTGVELYTDWHFLGLLPEIKLGVRGIYLLEQQSTEMEFLFGFSF